MFIFNDEDLIKEQREINKELFHCSDEKEAKNLRNRRKELQKRINRRILIRRCFLFVIAVILFIMIMIKIIAVCKIAYISIANANYEREQRRLARQLTEVTETESESETESETQTESKAAEPVEILMTFTGDCILGTDENFAWDTSLNNYYEMYGADYFMKNVKQVFENDDLTIINFEGTLTEETARVGNQFAFKGDPEFINILTGCSIEAANVANNHTHDYGEKSFEDTVSILKSNGIAPFGYDDVAVLDVKGVKVGIFGIYELDDHLERIPQMENAIGRLKLQNVDIIVGVFHWSNELVTTPDSNQFTLAHMAIDEGVDVIVGHHPHVVQGIELYKGKYIAYSLGNFCFGGNSNPTEYETMIFQQKFTLQGGEITNSEINVIPCLVSSDYTINNYQPMILEGDEADRVLGIINNRTASIEEALAYQTY